MMKEILAPNPVAKFVQSAIARGYVGLSLFVREGESKSFITDFLINAANPDLAEEIYEVAVSNATGFKDIMACFVLVASSGEPDGRDLTHSFSVMRPPSPHSMEKFDPSNAGMIRLLLEQNHRSHVVITEVIPIMLGHVSGVVGQLMEPICELAKTQAQTIKESRENKAATITAEREMLREAGRQQRIDKLIEMAIPAGLEVMQRLLPPKKEEG